MYLSHLKLNPRSRKAMIEVTHPYELHRTLMKAFPDKEADGPGRVLFRLDTDHEKSTLSILVQSERAPDWTYLNNNAANFLLEPAKSKPFNPALGNGQVLYFRLRANPTVKKSNGKRLGVLNENGQEEWLKHKAAKGGFEVISLTIVPEGIAHDTAGDKNSSHHRISLLSVRFEGVLRITDKQVFMRTIGAGIGSAKGLGFGLLSIAPLKER